MPGWEDLVPRNRSTARHWDVLLAVAAGGALGSLARYGVSVAMPQDPGEFPTATLLVNTSGCLLIGVLMAVITTGGRAHRLLRPFLGVGVLGGFTTFSTYVLDTFGTARAGAPVVALAYAAGTVLLALLAVAVGLLTTRAFLGGPAGRAALTRVRTGGR